MDKDYTRYVFTLFFIAIALLVSFGIKDYYHREDINKLLQAKSIESNIQPTEQVNNNSNRDYKLVHISNNKEESTSSDDKKDIISNKTIKHSSDNVEKKEETGIDLTPSNNDINNDEDRDYSEDYKSNQNINSDNIQLLARLIQSEAGDEPYQGKLAVGNVVLYRTQEDNTSITNTIYKKGQFDGVNTKNFNIQPSEECVEAAKEVMNGKKVLSDGYYFVNLKAASPSWATSKNFIRRIGDHWFFKKE